MKYIIIALLLLASSVFAAEDKPKQETKKPPELTRQITVDPESIRLQYWPEPGYVGFLQYWPEPDYKSSTFDTP